MVEEISIFDHIPLVQMDVLHLVPVLDLVQHQLAVDPKSFFRVEMALAVDGLKAVWVVVVLPDLLQAV